MFFSKYFLFSLLSGLCIYAHEPVENEHANVVRVLSSDELHARIGRPHAEQIVDILQTDQVARVREHLRDERLNRLGSKGVRLIAELLYGFGTVSTVAQSSIQQENSNKTNSTLNWAIAASLVGARLLQEVGTKLTKSADEHLKTANEFYANALRRLTPPPQE